MGGKHEMSHKDREISNEVVSRSRFISNGRLPINQVRRIVECSGYRSIWGNNNTNLTLVPIDRTRELSLKDNCMLVRVAPSRPVCATCGTQGVRACQTHFAHTGNAIYTHTDADHHCRVRAHQNNKRYPTARRGQSKPCAVASPCRGSRAATGHIALTPPRPPLHCEHNPELCLNGRTISSIELGVRDQPTLKEVVRSDLVRGRAAVVSAKDSVAFNSPRLAHLRVVGRLAAGVVRNKWRP